MKKRVTLLLALMLALGTVGTAFARAGDGGGFSIHSWADTATENSGALVTVYEEPHEENLELKMYAVEVGADSRHWAGEVATVYSFTLAWEVTPGVYSRTADTYTWDAEKLVYTRTSPGVWTTTDPALSLTLTNRSNAAIRMVPTFEPAEDVVAWMVLGDESELGAWSAAPAMLRDTDLLGEDAGSGYTFLNEEGEETTAECNMKFEVFTGFGNITDSIGTVAVSLEAANNILAQANQGILD